MGHENREWKLGLRCVRGLVLASSAVTGNQQIMFKIVRESVVKGQGYLVSCGLLLNP